MDASGSRELFAAQPPEGGPSEGDSQHAGFAVGGPDVAGSPIGSDVLANSARSTSRLVVGPVGAREGEAGVSQDDVPRYSYRGRLASGGMGTVWDATQNSLQRPVVIKCPHDTSPVVLSAIEREARILARLEHPNIVPLIDLVRDARSAPVLVMRKITGTSWYALLANPANQLWRAVERGSADRLEANLRVLMRVCGALTVAHRAGIVHRDVKPANVMIDDDGEVYLVDWGIAFDLTAGEDPADTSLLGTLGFMAPEMADPEHASISPQTDVYLLGSTLHYLLTGTARHRGETDGMTVARILASAPFDYPPAIPGDLARICNRATARFPADRYASVDAFQSDLAAFLARRSLLPILDQADAVFCELSTIAAGADADADAVHALGIESRFAYRAVLNQWPDCERARIGLSGCIRVLLEFELSRGNAQGARLFYAECDEPDHAIEERLAALDQHQADAKRALFDQDVGLAKGGEVLITRATAAAWLSLLALLAIVRAFVPNDPKPLLRYVAPPFAALLVISCLAIWRRRQFAVNATARHGLMLVTVVAVWITLFRAITLLEDRIVLHQVMWIEAMTAGAFLLLARIILRRAFVVSLVAVGVVVLLHLLFPAVRDYSSVLAMAAFGIAALEVVWLMPSRAR